jgi:hypothetical protein
MILVKITLSNEIKMKTKKAALVTGGVIRMILLGAEPWEKT